MFAKKRQSLLLLLSILFAAFANAATAPRLFWPTANTAFVEGQTQDDYLQATASGRIASGDWGCTRNTGSRFHEGVDLKSLNWKENGHSDDYVFAAAEGTIAHVNHYTTKSNYGKYIVIAHRERDLEWFSLYAHLGAIRSGLKAGAKIKAGAPIAVMGNTSSTIEIPKNRSHLHFEIGLRMNSYFDTWYARQDFDTPNDHGSWNGINLYGTNPLEFYKFTLENPKQPFANFFLNEPVSLEIVVYFERAPDFLLRSPAFLRSTDKKIQNGWYSVGLTWYGLPIAWEYLPDQHVDNRISRDSIIIRDLKHERPCRNWVNDVKGELRPTQLLIKLVTLLKTDRSN